MATVFNHMAGGRLWGTLFFLFMIFAALSTELAVFENILACVREITGWNRVKGSVICGIGMFLLSLTTALGFTALSGFQPFAEGSSFLDFWDFIVRPICCLWAPSPSPYSAAASGTAGAGTTSFRRPTPAAA